MRSSEVRQRFTTRLLPLLAAVGLWFPAYSLAAQGSQGPEDATRTLFAAVQTNDFQAVQSSIAAGADVAARNTWGNTAADLAVDKGYFRIAHYLVSVRNFQRPKVEPTATAGANARAALAQARPPAAAAMPAASPGAIAPAVAAPATADRKPPVVPTAAGGTDPFDPLRPAYGAALPAATEKGS